MSSALFTQMTETVHLRRQAQRHPTGDFDAQPRLLEFSDIHLPDASDRTFQIDQPSGRRARGDKAAWDPGAAL